MTPTLDCARAEERLPDLQEGLLDAEARLEVERHLASCPRCRELLAALGEVVEALRSSPEMDPARDLAERAATAALRAGTAPARRSVPARLLRFPRVAAATREVFASSVPTPVRGLAAALAIALTGGVLLVHSVVGPPVRAANRVVERTVNAGAYLAERKDRLVEDFRLLRVVIGTAFEGRLDRVNDRVDDYRRLLEQRRGAPTPLEPQPDASLPENHRGGAGRHVSGGAAPAQFVNFQPAPAVEPFMTREAGGRIGRPPRLRPRRLA
jgi:anti-sigma factor RsiW